MDEPTPTRSQELQALMRHAAGKLRSRLNDGGENLRRETVAAMAFAESILKTVAIFIADDDETSASNAASPLGSPALSGGTTRGQSQAAPAAPVPTPPQGR